jgi:hypothetical protein
MSIAVDDHRVNGRATPPTSALGITMSLGKRLASKVRRRATKKWRMSLQSRRHTVRVRLATGRGDVVRLIMWEKESVGGRGISKMRVWWRWW